MSSKQKDGTDDSGLKISAGNSASLEDDPRWQGEIADLLKQLDDEAVLLRNAGAYETGSKGSVEEIILALGSSGAIAATVAIFRAWLGRSADRFIKIKGQINGKSVDVEFDGKNIDEKTFRQALNLQKSK